jgi:hypothetical protein
VTVISPEPDRRPDNALEICALDLESGSCAIAATAHCRQDCPYQAMLRDGTAPVSDEAVVG